MCWVSKNREFRKEKNRETQRSIGEIDTARRNSEDINEVDCLDCNPRVEDQYT